MLCVGTTGGTSDGGTFGLLGVYFYMVSRVVVPRNCNKRKDEEPVRTWIDRVGKRSYERGSWPY